ncbi:hypothetical protein ACIRQH_37500 [Streptomyces sp. NPDC102279]
MRLETGEVTEEAAVTGTVRKGSVPWSVSSRRPAHRSGLPGW